MVAARPLIIAFICLIAAQYLYVSSAVNYWVILVFLVVASVFKHITLQQTAVRDKMGFIGVNIFIAVYMLLVWGVCDIFWQWRDIVQGDINNVDELMPFIVAFLKGVFVMLIITGKQWFAGNRKFHAYALVGLIGLGPLALVNYFTGEQLDLLQWVSIICLFVFGFFFMFYGEMRNVDNKGKLIFLLITVIGVAPAMTDNYAKMQNINWQTSWILSNIGLLLSACVFSLFKEGFAMFKSHIKSIIDVQNIAPATAWVFSEYVILFVMFTKLPVTITEASRNFYIPILMVVTAVVIDKNKKSWQVRKLDIIRALVWGCIAFVLALPLMIYSN